MPRPNPPREINAEDSLAERVRVERERRRWTPERLARALGEVGCPIQTSAIYRIEKGSPRRRITVNELVAFSRVFGIPPADLLDAGAPEEPTCPAAATGRGVAFSLSLGAQVLDSVVEWLARNEPAAILSDDEPWEEVLAEAVNQAGRALARPIAAYDFAVAAMASLPGKE